MNGRVAIGMPDDTHELLKHHHRRPRIARKPGRYGWGEIWTRPGFDHRTRRILVLGNMMIAEVKAKGIAINGLED